MNKNARQAILLEYLERHKSMTKQQAIEYTETSEATIHRDFVSIERKYTPKIYREHGLLIMREKIEEHITSMKKNENNDKKFVIAQLARTLVKDGNQIMVDSGTTCSQFVKTLYNANISVICSDIEIANDLTNNSKVDLFVLGGPVRKQYHSIIGDIACETLKNFIFDTLFISCDALCPDVGITNIGLDEVSIKKSAISRSKKVVLLVDSSKFFKQVNFPIAALSVIDVIVTDKPISPKLHDAIKHLNIEIVTPETIIL